MVDRPPRRERRRERATKSRAEPRSATRPAWLPWLLIVAATLGAVVLLRGRVVGPPPAARDSVATMEPRAALIEGTRLGNLGAYSQSLPYLRHGVAGMPELFVGHLNLASTLANVAIEVRQAHMDRAEPAMRSSDERIGSVIEGYRELDRAEALARTSAQRGSVDLARATCYETWGLPRDALAWARRAQAEAPATPGLEKFVRDLQTRLASGGRK